MITDLYDAPEWNDIFERAVRNKRTYIKESCVAPRPELVSTSSILTRLIQDAGRFCLHYASDLFISWESLLTSLKEPKENNQFHIFAMRESGVDANTFFIARSLDNPHFRDYYRAIWMVKVTCKEDSGFFTTTIEMVDIIYEISRNDCLKFEKYMK